MKNDRILLLLQAENAEAAADALTSAVSAADCPKQLTYGLLLQEEPDEQWQSWLTTLGSVLYVTGPVSPSDSMTSLWRGEGFVLLCSVETRFQNGWDSELLHAFRSVCGKDMRALLTGFPPADSDIVNAVAPVAADRFDEQGWLHFRKGRLLRYATEPERCAFLNPGFCFAAAGVFHLLKTDSTNADTPSWLRAFHQDIRLYTLHKPVVTVEHSTPAPTGILPSGTDEELLTRFEERFGIHFAEKTMDARARNGIYRKGAVIPTHVPWLVRRQEAKKAVQNSNTQLMCATVILSSSDKNRQDTNEKLQRFKALSALENLPLLCFAGSDWVRKLSLDNPNVLEYKKHYAMPIAQPIKPDETKRYMRLSKPFLLSYAREKMLGYTHYAWIDFGYLRYPVYSGAAITTANICSDRTVMAIVDGKPDCSMIVIPEGQIQMICQEFQHRISMLQRDGHALPEEAAMWQWLIGEHPDWFDLITTSGTKELLSMTMTPRSEESDGSLLKGHAARVYRVLRRKLDL